MSDHRLSSSLNRFVHRVDDNVHLSSPEFMTLIDEEKKEFRRYGLRSKDDVTTQLYLVKILNLLINKHEYFSNRIVKVGRPSGFMLDPANACQLGCPTCQHSFNRKYTGNTYVPMPKGIMREHEYSRFITKLGPYCFAGHFYNNSEPLLNKQLPSYLGTANLYRINTIISTNLSLPNVDIEGLVSSGLNTLMVAIDGTTQDTYVRYRRGGDLALVLDNVSKLADAKKRLKSPTPRLRWQFLTFQHNVHQVDDAIALAKKIGFDSFNLATPFDVSGDEPTVMAVHHPLAGDGDRHIHFNPEPLIQWTRNLAPIAGEINAAFSESAVERFDILSRGEPQLQVEQRHGYCDWLHLGLISDALGRIVPCCIPDYQGHGTFVFGSLKADEENLFNTTKYRQARLYLANEDLYRSEVAGGRESRSKCDGCANRPLPQIGLGAIGNYLNTSIPGFSGWSSPKRLTGWSRHTVHDSSAG